MERPMARPIREPVRLSVNLSPDVAEALRELAARKGTTISDIVRDAISTENFLYDEQKSGAEILVRKKDGSVKQLLLR